MSDFADIEIVNTAESLIVTCSGMWTLPYVPTLSKKINTTFKDKKIIFDVSKVEDFDTLGILLLIETIKKLESQKCSVKKTGESENFIALYDVCEKNFPEDIKQPEALSKVSEFLYDIGKATYDAKVTLISFFSFLGGFTKAFLNLFIKPKNIRFNAILYHIENSGLNALPIIFLISFLIGIILAFQGAVQLEKFGANIYIVETVTLSVVRELAPLLTAIVIAGRSSSSFTAQIGVMKLTEEIDAMRAMGFSIWDFLIIPRVLALVISLPLLVFFSDVVSVFGGMIIASGKLGISFEEFILRIQETVEIRHVIIGLVKAPIFGAIIAIVGCFRGFQISSSTESVGKYTTISVVNAIFWVIAMDAVISIFLTELSL
jgi:phospholipid/cholesterol/gamma-HCH transport system permease protein